MSVSDMRREYGQRGLAEQDVVADPIEQFRAWFEVATSAGFLEPNAMTLATCAADGRPSARTVLLKEVDARGFVFYSHYTSRKGQELAANPFAALVFYWDALERQVRVEGQVEHVDATQSDAYFSSRPRGSRLGALASPQSEVVPSREWLEERLSALEAQYHEGDVPRPQHWGGYRVVPDVVEFWQGRPNRLHDRIRYRRDGELGWKLERLAP